MARSDRPSFSATAGMVISGVSSIKSTIAYAVFPEVF
jgi:hypothetical protein